MPVHPEQSPVQLCAGWRESLSNLCCLTRKPEERKWGHPWTTQIKSFEELIPTFGCFEVTASANKVVQFTAGIITQQIRMQRKEDLSHHQKRSLTPAIEESLPQSSQSGSTWASMVVFQTLRPSMILKSFSVSLCEVLKLLPSRRIYCCRENTSCISKQLIGSLPSKVP